MPFYLSLIGIVQTYSMRVIRYIKMLKLYIQKN